MEGFLDFLADLILLTAGLAVMLLWLVILIGIAVETYDFFKDRGKSEEEILDPFDTGGEG